MAHNWTNASLASVLFPENEKREYFSEPSAPSEATPPMYPTSYAREFQPALPQGHYGPYGYHENILRTLYELSGAGRTPPPPPLPHHGGRPHPDDPFFYEGEHQKPYKNGIMRKVLIGSALACGGFILFNMGRIYELNAMRQGADHPHDIARHGGPHSQHYEFSAEGMHRGEVRPRLFGHAGKFGHRGPEGFRPDLETDFKPGFDPEFDPENSVRKDHHSDIAGDAGFRPLKDPHGPPPFPEFDMHHGKPCHKGRKGPKSPETHEELSDKSGDESDDASDVAVGFKGKWAHAEDMRNSEKGPKGPRRKHSNKSQVQRAKDEMIRESSEITSEVVSEKLHSELDEKLNPVESSK